MVSVSNIMTRSRMGFLSRQDGRAAICPHTKFDPSERLSYLQSFGSSCLSFSIFQKNMRFFDVRGKGFMAYQTKWGTSFVLSEPICSETDKHELIDRFLAFKPKTVFVQISEKTAQMLYETHGFFSTQLGIESDIDLATWTIGGKKKQVLRTAVNQARKQGIVICEGQGDIREDELNRQWLKTRKTSRAEIGFLIRSKALDIQQKVRKFYAYRGNRLIGYIFFDPVFSRGRITGYVPNISRFCQDFKQGIFYCLMIHAINVFHGEGIRWMHLGLSPAVVDKEFKNFESPWMKKLIRWTYENGNSLYNFKGLHFTKSRFRGLDRNVYCAHNHRMALKNFVCMFKICNII